MLTLLALSLLGADGLPPLAEWRLDSPRDELAPRLDRLDGGAVRLTGTSAATFGRLLGEATVAGGVTYRLGVDYRADGVDFPAMRIRLRVCWLDANGRGLRSDWVNQRRELGDGWTRAERLLTAPDGAARAELELSIRWTTGSVTFREARLEPADAPAAPRRIKLATVCFTPRGGTPESNRAAWAAQCAAAGAMGADIVCLGEGITLVGTGQSMAEVAEPVPGPTTEVLGRVAAEHRMYIVAGVYERAGAVIYNTAVLLGRDGELAGRYRKVHLPESEVQAGLTPAAEYPVFDTDFGTIGIQICYDAMFPEEAQALALGGAEIIFTPIWGDGRSAGTACEIIPRARAIDHGVWFVTSNYTERRSLIVDPWGTIRADSGGSEGVFVIDCDLDERRRQHWLSVEAGGYWREFIAQERRPDTYGVLAR